MGENSISNHFRRVPLLRLAALVKLHLKGGCTRAGKDGGLVAAVLIVVRGLHLPGSQHHWLLGLVPALLIHLIATWHKINVFSYSQAHTVISISSYLQHMNVEFQVKGHEFDVV